MCFQEIIRTCLQVLNLLSLLNNQLPQITQFGTNFVQLSLGPVTGLMKGP